MLPFRLQNLQNTLLEQRQKQKLWLQNGDTAFADAPSNIALLKYWGKSLDKEQAPANSSLSITLNHLKTKTKIKVLKGFFTLEPRLCDKDAKPLESYTPVLSIDHKPIQDLKLQNFIKRILTPFATDICLSMDSENAFPMSCGIASSASGYAALVLALADLLQIQNHFSKEECQYWLHHWARLGSGSASRSVDVCAQEEHVQAVIWNYDQKSDTHSWELPSIHSRFFQLQHKVLVLCESPKEVSSSHGHVIAHQLPLQRIRVAMTPMRMDAFKHALSIGDFDLLQRHTEEDAFMMHAVMQSSVPRLEYLNHETAQVIAHLIATRKQAPVLWTLDAGPNLHVLFLPEAEAYVQNFITDIRLFLARNIPIL